MFQENYKTTSYLDNQMPYFEDNKEKNVTSYLGKNVYLPCRIKQLGDRTVILLLIHLHVEHENVKNVSNHL